MPDFLETFNKQNAKSYGGQKIGTGKKGLSFVDIFASEDDPKLRKKLTGYYKQQEELKKKPIADGLKKGMSWEDISSQTGVPLEEVQALSRQIDPNYGVKPADTRNILQKAGSVAKGVGEAFASSYDRVSKGTAEVLGGATQEKANQAQAQADDVSTDIVRKASLKLKDPNTPEDQKKRIRELVTKVTGQTTEAFGTQQARLKEIQERTDPVKGAAAVGSIGFDVLTAGTIGNAAKAGKAGLVARGATEGAVSGGLSSIEQKGRDVTLKDLAQGAAVGGAIGGGLTAGSEALGKYVREYKSGKISKASEKFAKENPAAAKTAKQMAEAGIAEPDQIATRKTSELVSYEGAPDRAAVEAYKQRIQAGEAPEPLIVRRDSTGALGVEDGKHRLQAYQELGIEDVPVVDKTVAQPQMATQGLAANTEARAVQNELTSGFGDLPQYQKINMADQAEKATNLLDVDYEAAKRIALSGEGAPGDLLPTSVYKAVERRATQDGDVALLHQLASESAITKEATKKGQYISALAQRDPESPVAAMQDILNARKNSTIKDLPKDLNPQEAQQITTLAQDVAAKKAAIAEGADRLEYGRARVVYDNYINDLKMAANKKTIKEKVMQNPGDSLTEIAGAAKGIKAALDNSALFRQGWKTMFINPVKWQKNARQSFVDIAKTFGGKNMMDELKADIISRPNADMYQKMGLDVFDIAEEAYPSALPERIPGVGRAFKASEAAYTGFLQRMRADVADKYIDIATRNGVDLADARQAESIGKLVNSLTGRGHLGHHEKGLRVLNNLFFSPRNLKANVDFLTAHQLQKDVSPFVRKEAAKNLAKVVAGTATILATAEALKPGSVEWDPRSSNFGKIKVGNTRFDVSGGMSSIVTLAARVSPALVGMPAKTKSSATGLLTTLGGDEFGARTVWDVVSDFVEGKFSPAAGFVKEWMTGENFIGEKKTKGQATVDLFTPLPYSNYRELKNDPKSANTLGTMIADGLGIGTNTYSSQKDWAQSNTKQITEFKSKVDGAAFAEANDTFNQEYTDWLSKVTQDKRFQGLPETAKKTLLSSKSQQLTKDVLKRYGYEYKPERSKDNTADELKKL